jgi:hypothetical protein
MLAFINSIIEPKALGNLLVRGIAKHDFSASNHNPNLKLRQRHQRALDQAREVLA